MSHVFPMDDGYGPQAFAGGGVRAAPAGRAPLPRPPPRPALILPQTLSNARRPAAKTLL
jgi:hypothetical protein